MDPGSSRIEEEWGMERGYASPSIRRRSATAASDTRDSNLTDNLPNALSSPRRYTRISFRRWSFSLVRFRIIFLELCSIFAILSHD